MIGTRDKRRSKSNHARSSRRSVACPSSDSTAGRAGATDSATQASTTVRCM